jgi:DNA-binding GntR family transcriptional regulator
MVSARSKARPAGETAEGEVVRVRGSGAQRVYETLRKSILELTLEPGSPLDEVSLSERFDMSRTPIREALVRLAAEGLVTSLPNRNTIVAPIDFVRLPVYFEALTLMYRVTTRLAGANRQEEQLIPIRAHQAAFADAVARRDAPAMISSNREFHVAISEAGGNIYFTQMFARLLDEGRRILRLYYSSFDDRLPRSYVEEHEEIVRAIEKGDPALCDRLAAQHAGQIVRQIQDYIARTSIAGMMLG